MRKQIHAVVLYPSEYASFLSAKRVGARPTAFPQLGLDAAREMITQLAEVFRTLKFVVIGNYKTGYTMINPDNDKRFTLEITGEWREEKNVPSTDATS